jgi:hypothetical protein
MKIAVNIAKLPDLLKSAKLRKTEEGQSEHSHNGEGGR